MSQFKFVLDDFIELEEQPIGWETAEIVIKRNDEIGSLFIEYLRELEFWGKGYTYIKSQIDAIGYCFTIKIDITYQCTPSSQYEKVFTGWINVSRAQINNEKCTVTCNLEVDDVFADFLSSVERKVELSSEVITLANGNTINSPIVGINYHNVESGVATYGEWTNNAVNCWRAIDGLNYITQVLTDGKMSVVSDFYSNVESLMDKWSVTLSGDLWKGGETMTIKYRNIWGIEVSKSFVATIFESPSLSQLGWECCEISNLSNLNSGSICNEFFHYGFANAYVDPLFPRVIQFESWLPIEIVSVEVTEISNPKPTITIEHLQTYQKGGKGLYFSTQFKETVDSLIWDYQQVGNPVLSFQDLFNELNALHGIGMMLEGPVGNYKIRIEPLEYFYAQDSQLTLTDLMNVTSAFDEGNNFKSVKVGSASSDFGVIRYQGLGGISGASITSGTNTLTFTSSSVSPVAGDYLLSYQTLEVYRVESIVGSTITTTRNSTTTTTSSTFALGGYQQVSVLLAYLNRTMSLQIDSCVGSELDLTNQFITEIEKHGDQTKASFSSRFINISGGSNNNVFTFLTVDTDLAQTKPAEYVVRDYPGGSSNVPYFRWAFNWDLTNHHKIINNFLRIKYDVGVIFPSFTESSGEEHFFRNTAPIRPSVIHTFEKYLSFTDMITLLENPSQTVVAQINGNSMNCWVKEVTFNINTKKASFQLIESL